MWFSKRSPAETGVEATNSAIDKAEANAPTSPARVSTADTAHLIGPGCVKLVGQVPTWQPLAGAKLQLHPQYLQRVFCYGNVDFSTAVLRLMWKRGIQVSFLSPSGNSLLGRLQPAGGAPNLPRLQHLAAANVAFSLSLAQEIVINKIESQRSTARYFQQQGKGSEAGRVINLLKTSKSQVEGARTMSQVRGIEGTTSSNWFRFLATVLPAGWEFPRRVARPATDPVNALLSLGYMLAHHRCESLLAAADLDPRVGFLHDVRPGRASLACDLVESLRAPLVDRLVVSLLARRTFTSSSFVRRDTAWRLQPDDFKRFLAAFEQVFFDATKSTSFHQQTLDEIDRLRARIRTFATTNVGGEP